MLLIRILGTILVVIKELIRESFESLESFLITGTPLRNFAVEEKNDPRRCPLGRL